MVTLNVLLMVQVQLGGKFSISYKHPIAETGILASGKGEPNAAMSHRHIWRCRS